MSNSAAVGIILLGVLVIAGWAFGSEFGVVPDEGAWRWISVGLGGGLIGLGMAVRTQNKKKQKELGPEA
ncbi:hypothetical protein HGQ17_13735 [Nesterenkonia sp. MY13]|uniref:Uncharacterized protein n=1 Tax=Nesterenkonia sedimenti TaxID=1463632 RepID=A0A7X8YF55_9MICC|nr:hypothetical protein [Nesterenkonia sedimenti]NLS11036.1 hypothetical protein [Nesterenkonia sedimenti]